MKTKVGKQLKREFMINKIVRDEKKRKEIGEASQVSHCKRKFMECRFIENPWLTVIDKLGNHDTLSSPIETNYQSQEQNEKKNVSL